MTTMATQADKGNTRIAKVPAFSFSHGSEMATVKVGKEPIQETFHVHKQVLSQASEYFNRALNDMFKESTGVLTLEHHCTIAFEAVCRWASGGQRLKAEHFDTFKEISKYYYQLQDNWHQLFYLRLLKLADETMIPELRIHAYESLTKIFFRVSPSAMPETNFLRELFDADVHVALLDEYLVDFAGWIIKHDACRDPREWDKTF